jgi:hypothetical protein
LSVPIEDEDEILDVWPENWLVWDLWHMLGKRWRLISDLAGTRYQGLDLQQLESLMNMKRIPLEDQERLLEQLDEMEDVAIEAIYA